jgi:ABC-type dipeptide/oligopeptide/nickel transport system permease subunit
MYFSTRVSDISLAVPAPAPSRIARRLQREWPAAWGAAFLLVLVVAALAAPVITGYAYDAQDLDRTFQAPSRLHWLGTDQYGRDIFTRVVYGARISLTVAFSAVAAEAMLGVAWGTIAGYIGGGLDNALMRVVDLFIAFPSLLLAVLVTGLFGQSLVNIVVALTMTAWPGMARTIRSEVLVLRDRDFVEAARALGASTRWVTLQHLVPNIVHLLAARATLDVSVLILTEATLSFIGIGVQPPRPSWGLMISDSFQWLQSHPYLVIVPSVILSVTVLSFNLVGESLAGWFDPLRGPNR